MFAHSRSLVVAVLALFMIGGSAAAQPGDTAGLAGPRTVKGSMSLHPVAGAACASAIGVCYSGTISGTLRGTVDGTASSLVQTADTPTTSVVVLTAEVTVVLTDGSTLLLKEARVLRTAGEGSTTAIWSVVGSTPPGATGQLRVSGFFDPQAGGDADYRGTLTLG